MPTARPAGTSGSVDMATMFCGFVGLMAMASSASLPCIAVTSTFGGMKRLAPLTGRASAGTNASMSRLTNTALRILTDLVRMIASREFPGQNGRGKHPTSDGSDCAAPPDPAGRGARAVDDRPPLPVVDDGEVAGPRTGKFGHALSCPVPEFWRRSATARPHLHLSQDLLGGPASGPSPSVSPVGVVVAKVAFQVQPESGVLA